MSFLSPRALRAFGIVVVAQLVGGLETTAIFAQERFTPRHVARLRTVSDAKLSPFGTRAAYLLSVPRKPLKDDDGRPWSELHVVDTSGASRPYIIGKVNISSIGWMPDGQAVSFVTKRGDDKENALYIIPIDGGEARRVLTHDVGVGSYSWHPDGRRVAFVAGEKKPKKLNEREDKGFKAEIYEEDWRPSKVWIAEISDLSDPWEETADDANESEDGGEAAVEKSTPAVATRPGGKPRALDLPGSAAEVKWSPDGKLLAITLAPTPLVDDSYMNQKLHVIDAETGEIVTRIETPGKLGSFEWSGDSKRLAIIAAADRNDPAEGRLIVASASDGTYRDVLPNLDGHVTSIAWQNADTIMYLADERVTTSFGKVNADGSEQKTLVPSGKQVLSGLSLSRDGMSGVMLCSASTHPPEVFAMKHGDDGPRRLTDSNPWLSDMRFAPQEVVTYKARDGLEIDGILIRPLDEQRGKRYPLILCVHGGPEAHEANGWLTNYSRPGQVAAARGFAVFYPNYRGSTGRGVGFSKMGQNDMGGKEFDDLVDAVDHLVASGLVDGAKVGVTGGSYGGYASAWCATALTERFAASVMFVGISDQVSKFGTTDIPQEMYLVHERQYPWDDWAKFQQRSPVYHAPKARTPILILHGKDDPRVHPSQSMQMYRYLKTLGEVPVRLVMYPGEGHGNRKAASRLDYNMRMMQWFEHYLTGPGGDAPAWELDYDAEMGKAK
ncbi:MAG: S9 family peptidase [Phycisphaerae bacterium]|nr:S9 family peptidase [Phycisphaerae bacterium]NUQ45366.1 S9 family peptidase [Phycisphaerae bacterium]